MNAQPEVLIRADELESIGAESSLARAMAAHSLRLLYAENQRLHEVNAELVEALKAMLGCCYDMERNDETLAAVKGAMKAIYNATGEKP